MAVFLFAVGAIVFYDAVRLGFRYDPQMGPGAGFLPFYLSVGTMIGTVIIIIKGLKKLKEGPDKRLIPEGGLKPILWVLIPSTVMVMLIPLIGLHFAAFVYLLFYMREVGKIEWVKCLLVSILFPFGLYIIFDRLFLIPLPSGWLGNYLPYLPLPF
ncbi:MAG: tripartite tricarboxylate transporter TctB family protein [Deltaproteobacteria bacterium]|nr:tripartite tricarboxylate transporter TctB family protein [Deltaproteobacteria bacterium]